MTVLFALSNVQRDYLRIAFIEPHTREVDLHVFAFRTRLSVLKIYETSDCCFPVLRIGNSLARSAREADGRI